MTAVAIFVKTPGLSPVKTRLAQGMGGALATEFHRRAAAAVGAVAGAAGSAIRPHWAVAERAALAHPAWRAFPTLWQGEGELGARLDRVYAELLERHGAVLLIGADAPQLTPALLADAARIVRDGVPPYAIGPATDGGFWLFGGRAPVPAAVWHAVAYSRADTGARLADALLPFGAISWLPTLADTDECSDLPGLASALQTLRDPLPEQANLRDWLPTLRQTLAFPELAQETSGR
ncbi:MAG: TIGR04282 family arsenosugar biosynthesis glycosyltransferase [Acetobacteraceae bacterium]